MEGYIHTTWLVCRKRCCWKENRVWGRKVIYNEIEVFKVIMLNVSQVWDVTCFSLNIRSTYVAIIKDGVAFFSLKWRLKHFVFIFILKKREKRKLLVYFFVINRFMYRGKWETLVWCTRLCHVWVELQLFWYARAYGGFEWSSTSAFSWWVQRGSNYILFSLIRKRSYFFFLSVLRRSK